MSQLTSLEDLKDLSGYKKDLKKSLDKVQASPAKMFYTQSFEFKGRKGPMVLVGELPSGLTKGLKEAKVPLKAGRCRRNERGELEVFKGLDPGKIGVALKVAGIPETIAEREVEGEVEEELATPETPDQPPEMNARMNRKLEFENEEFRKRAEAAFKTKEKDVLVEVQKFASEHKDNPEALQGVKDVKNEILRARESASRGDFDEANSVLDRVLNAVRFTGTPTSTKPTASEEPTVLGYSSPVKDTYAVYGQPIPAEQKAEPRASGPYGREIEVDKESGQKGFLYSMPETPGTNPSAYSKPDIPGEQPVKEIYSTPDTSAHEPSDEATRVPEDIPSGQGPGKDDAKKGVSKEFVDKMKGVTIEKGKFGDAAETEANPHGFKTRSVGEEYVGEHEKATWRGGIDPNNPNYVTRKYSEEERKQKTLDVDAEGNVRNADGTLANVDAEYVVDPKTGKMVKLEMKVEEATKDPRTGETVRTPLSGTVGKALKDGKKLEATHHSSPLGGYETDQQGKTVRKGVAGAGAVEVRDGKVKKINNASGHYKPKLVQLLQTLEHLAKQGAILDKTIVDAEGKTLQDKNPKAFALYNAVKKAGENAKQLAADAKKIMAQMDEAESEDQLQTLGQQLDEINKQLAAIRAKTDTASDLLRKIGAGPSNKIDPEAKVEFVDAKDGLTGLQVHQAQKTTTRAAEFMKTGGGNRDQADKKRAMMDELKKEAADTRQELDKEAESRAQATQSDTARPTADDFDKALKDLDPGPEAEFEKLGGIPALQGKYERVHGDSDPYGWTGWSVEEKVEFLKKVEE